VKRRFRLTRSSDFQRVRRIGKSYAHPLIVCFVAQNALQQVRVGVAAGRVVGTAVQRNRAKRRLRACLEAWLPCLPAGWDLVFLARKPAEQAEFAELCAAVEGLMKRAGLLHDGP
jgi:ribonuclease P protein component